MCTQVLRLFPQSIIYLSLGRVEWWRQYMTILRAYFWISARSLFLQYSGDHRWRQELNMVWPQTRKLLSSVLLLQHPTLYLNHFYLRIQLKFGEWFLSKSFFGSESISYNTTSNLMCISRALSKKQLLSVYFSLSMHVTICDKN